MGKEKQLRIDVQKKVHNRKQRSIKECSSKEVVLTCSLSSLSN